jgi:hypothetical protein
MFAGFGQRQRELAFSSKMSSATNAFLVFEFSDLGFYRKSNRGNYAVVRATLAIQTGWRV